MLEDQKEKLKQYQRDYYSSQKTIKWNNNFFLHNIKMNEKTLKFGDVEGNKKNFMLLSNQLLYI